jgi:hypothetical protein
MPEIENTRMLAAALASQLRVEAPVMTRAIRPELLQLSLLTALQPAAPADGGVPLESAPAMVEGSLTGSDGTVYFLPQARIARRSKVSPIPHVFLDKRAGEVVLQVWFDLGPHSSLPTGAKPLPIENVAASLVGEDGTAIAFPRCDLLPASDGAPEGASRLYCEAPVDVNQAVGILQSQGSRFRIEADVAYSLFEMPGGIVGPVRDHRRERTFDRRRFVDPGRVALPMFDALRIRPELIPEAVLAGPLQPVGTNGAAGWQPYRVRLSLTASNGDGVRAYFSPEIPENRPIYARVTSGFGAEPWSQWVDSPHGAFMDSPVPDQFYIVPDEYRLVVDRDTGEPSLQVLLVPPKTAADATGPVSFGSSYTLRTRFGVVPWVDPSRRERLRASIAENSGIPYPQLVVGGLSGATCALSRALHALGSTLVGAENEVAVDPAGFELVLDCTSEFYSTLAHLLVTDGVDAVTTLTLLSDAETPTHKDVPVSLRLDRPATDVLSTEFRPGVPAVTEGDRLSEASPPVLRVTNPLGHPVSVARVRCTLLVVDESLPSPIGAVTAAAAPESFVLGPAGDPTSTVDLVLTADASDLPPVYGAVGADFLDLAIDIDPDAVLAKAHDTGGSGSVASTVDLRCYQLQHPESMPPALADVYGLEVQLRRSEGAAAVTAFLTKDQPDAQVQVAFTLADILSGAKPEQPTFQWRRRNKAGAGDGEWSEWESITGRQLFVSPTGM